MTADELRSGVDYDIRPVLYGTYQVRSTERIINNQWNPVAMGNFGNGININDIGIGIAQGFDKYGFRIFLNGFFKVR